MRGGVRAAILGAGCGGGACGVFMPWRLVGAGAWGVSGNAAKRLVSGFVAVLTNAIAAGVVRSFKEIDRTGVGVERRRSRQGDWLDSVVV